MVLSFADLSVWCFACDSYVHNKVRNKISSTYCDNAGTILPQVVLPHIDSAHRHKFGEPSPYAPQAAEEDKP